ncbi:MAG: histidine kinase [Flavobacteriales bacterium]
MNSTDLALGIIVATLLLVLLIGTVLLLLVRNTSRRNHHRAELAELELRHAQEVMASEREATRHTLQEVGGELHDNVAQLLMVVHMGLNWGPDDQAPDPRLDPAREALAECISEVRRLGHTLNTDMWEKRTLEEALRDLSERLGRTGKLGTSIVVEGIPEQLPGDVSTVLFRVCQEVVTNTVKHSGAEALTITLRSSPPRITLSDNGRGFNPATVIANAGFHNIQRRCSLIGFEAECRSALGEGCTWDLRQRVPTGSG